MMATASIRCRTLLTAAMALHIAPASLEGQPACRVTEQWRTRLTDGSGNRIYIEPQALVANGGRVLLAGNPNLAWRPRTGDGVPELQWRNRWFGAVLTDQDEITLVPAPIEPGHVGRIRLTANRDGSWTALFSELATANGNPTESPVGIWRGSYDGKRWSDVARLPVPDGANLNVWGSSALLETRQRSFWAVPYAGADRQNRVMLFHRTGGRWAVDTIGGAGATYAQLGETDGTGTSLLIVHPDSSAGPDLNSLFEYRFSGETGTAARGHRLVRGLHDPVFEPVVAFTRFGRVVSWISQAENGSYMVRARLESDPARVRTFTVDSDVDWFSTVRLPHGDLLWVSVHATETRAQRLRVAQLTAEGSETVFLAVNPFRGYATAVAIDERGLVVVGPEMLLQGADMALVTLAIRLRLDCQSALSRQGAHLRAPRYPPPLGGSHETDR